jgi:hypothetical protein
MADLSADIAKRKKPLIETPKDSQIKVTPENAGMLTVHFLAQIHGRLGYIIKLLEGKK